MEKPQIVALVGMPGAGKSSCVDHIVSQGFPSVYFGGIIIDEVKKRDLEVNEVNEKQVREDMRAKEGKEVVAKLVIRKTEELAAQGHRKVVVDGLYSWSEYKLFKDHFGDNVTIVAVAAPRKLRHERLAKRPVRPLTDKEVTDREYAEIENLEKGGPIANADYTLVNDTNIENMLQKLDEVLSDIGFVS